MIGFRNKWYVCSFLCVLGHHISSAEDIILNMSFGGQSWEGHILHYEFWSLNLWPSWANKCLVSCTVHPSHTVSSPAKSKCQAKDSPFNSTPFTESRNPCLDSLWFQTRIRGSGQKANHVVRLPCTQENWIQSCTSHMVHCAPTNRIPDCRAKENPWTCQVSPKKKTKQNKKRGIRIVLNINYSLY